MVISHIWIRGIIVCLSVGALAASATAAKFVDVRTVDDEQLQVHWLDGEVEYKDTGTGRSAFLGGTWTADDVVHRYEPGLDPAAAVSLDSYTVSSTDDANYAKPAQPVAAYRKTKVNGTNNREPSTDYTLEHTVYLKLPQNLKQGGHYTLTMAAATKTDTASQAFTFDIYASVSEALHVNLIGYNPDHTVVKAADLYMWMGDGGGRDYSNYAGRKVLLHNVESGKNQEVGTVKFWKKSGSDFGGWNATSADVWNCDFSSFTGTGTYRLAVEGMGCSPDFKLSRDIYYEPFKTSVRGFYYMRIGEDKDWALSQHLPVPRQPRYIPGVDPPDFKVYLTTYGPGHPDWKKGGDWDRHDWSKYNEPGEPTNPNAWGGHADATDWDRNPGHISIIWDLLLPYFLSNGKIRDDNLQIRESGNGIPDIIDEARNEVDFWLRVRDTKGGYSAGLNNPGIKGKEGGYKPAPVAKDTVIYQAAASPYMAWASAANCAMLADCFRLAGKPDLMKYYRDAALEAWKTAGEQGLDASYEIGNGQTRGRDLKMMAGAFLYNVTGETIYEDAMARESLVTGPTSELDIDHKACQLWGTAAYLMCAKNKWQPIHHATLLENMSAAMLHEALQKNVSSTEKWPSRRSSNNAYGWYQSTQDVQAVCIAHATAGTAADKEALLKALILEADYGLGRNPMNMVQMTGLGSRCCDQICTTGRNDGVPGVHPGHTPYMNANAWGKGFKADPQWLAVKGYPAWKDWPHGEALWVAPYSYSISEFTPQQSMRGKMCLLGYLYSLGEEHK